MITKKTRLSLILGASLGITGIAFGDDDHYGKYQQSYNYDGVNNEREDFARVINVDPITETVELSTPVEKCWNKQVRNEHYPHHTKHNHKHEIFGAIIGAAVGNQIGKRSSGRNGRDIATAAGAVIGGVIGNDIAKHKRQHQYQKRHVTYSTVKHCETEQRVSYQEQVVAYKVRYKYRGQVYTTRMNQHPGNRIKVRVSVTPVVY